MVKDDPNSWQHRFAKYRKEFHEGAERRRKMTGERLGVIGDREINYIVFRAKPGMWDAKEEVMDCRNYLDYVYASICEAEAHFDKVSKEAERLGMKVDEVKEERRKEREKRT